MFWASMPTISDWTQKLSEDTVFGKKRKEKKRKGKKKVLSFKANAKLL